VKSIGLYPRVRVDTSRTSAVGQAGGVLLVEVLRRSGLDEGLSAGLARWRRPTATHDPAKIICDLAVSSAVGGDCLADVGVLRSEPGVYGRVASDPTVSRTITALAADLPAVLAAEERERERCRGRRPCQLLCVNTSEEVRAQDGRHEGDRAGEGTSTRSGGSAAGSGVLRGSDGQRRRGWGAADW
jgi:Transposase DDE domain group 1